MASSTPTSQLIAASVFSVLHLWPLDLVAEEKAARAPATEAVPEVANGRGGRAPADQAVAASAAQSSNAPREGESERAILIEPTGPFVDISPRWPSTVLDGINACRRSMTCPTLFALKASHSQEFEWVLGWCKARAGDKSSNSDEREVCTAFLSNNDENLRTTSTLKLARVASDENPPECGGFGLTIPLYSIRYAHGQSDVKGPVAAGLGGGYYWVPPGLCRESFSAGPEIFAYSEGLDPSGLFHIGLAAGAQIAAYRYFQFGVSLGYDLYRRQPSQDATTGASLVEKSGLFDGSFHRSDFTVLLTFSVTGQGDSAAKTNQRKDDI